MTLPHRSLIAMAIMFFFFVQSAAAVNAGTAVTTNFTQDPSANLSGIAPSDLVQTASMDKIKDEWKMPKEWQGNATVEVYILSDNVVNVGGLVGSALYGTIWEKLDRLCQARIGKTDQYQCKTDESWSFDVWYKENGNRYQPSKNQVEIISSKFTDKQTRNLLMGAIAGAYQAMTENPRNCYNANNPKVSQAENAATNFRYCNVALRVGAYTPDSHMYAEVRSDIEDDDDGTFRCCETRSLIDSKLDELKSELMSVYPTKSSRKFRNVECHLGCEDGERLGDDYKWVGQIDVDKILSEMIKNSEW